MAAIKERGSCLVENYETSLINHGKLEFMKIFTTHSEMGIIISAQSQSICLIVFKGIAECLKI
jgi:hypothetical protein